MTVFVIVAGFQLGWAPYVSDYSRYLPSSVGVRAFYGNVLIFLAYLFTPWTAINLTDYFFVRRGLYSIKEIFRPTGMYGSWGWRGQVAYLVGLLVMVPFMVTTPFTGFAARALGGVDYSIFIGLPVAGLLYLALCRSLDLAAERRVVEAEGLVQGVR